MTSEHDAALLAQIAAGLEDRFPQSADLARDPDTELKLYPLAFLRERAIYELQYLGPYDDVVFFVGVGNDVDGPVSMLTGHPHAFTELLQGDGIHIQDAALAIACSRAWIETTRTMGDLLYIVSSIDDLRFLPPSDDERAAAVASCRARWEQVISPPQASEDGPPFTVLVYVVREQALERHSITVAEDATITSQNEVLANRLPLVFSR